MSQTSLTKNLGLKLAFLPLFALPLSAGIMLPTAEWGSGVGTVLATVYNYSGNSYCSLTTTPDTCSVTAVSNQPHNFLNNPDGTAHGIITAYTDANGVHVYAEAGGSGFSSTTAQGAASMYDTIYNPTNVAAQYQFTFHLDAELFTRSSASEWLDFSFNNGAGFQTQLGYGGAGTYSFVDQNITTGIFTVAANSYRNWSAVLSTSVSVSTQAGATYAAGLPLGFVDASNTLSLTAISIFDTDGNPLTSSGLTSYAGFDYSQSNTGATPEPATAVLMVGALAILGWATKNRR